jgi:DNA-directed RNA polymerase alpha subunit
MYDRATIQWAVEHEVTIADLEIINFPERLRDLLDNRGIIMLEQLLSYTFEELDSIPGIGDKYIKSIKTMLEQLPLLKQRLEHV